MTIMNLMKLFPLLCLMILIINNVTDAQVNPDCLGGIRVRKEFRDLTKEEWTRFKRALMILRRIPRGFKKSKYDEFTRVHLKHAKESHGTPQFLPWHRMFLLRFEDALREIDPTVTVPYWHWAQDYRQPLASPIFLDEYFGSKFGIQGDCKFRSYYPKPHCLVRSVDPGNFTTYVNTAGLNKITNDRRANYDRFRRRIEGSPHAQVHFSIGGNVGDGGDMRHMYSVNDPIFWLHHGMIDLLWAEWQKNTGNYESYGGNIKRTKIKATLNDPLVPFNVLIANTTRIDRLCYQYAPYSRRKMRASSDDDDESVPIPSPLPQEWLEMMGMDVEDTRESEAYFAEAMRESQLQTKTKSPATAKSEAIKPYTFTLLSLFIPCLLLLL